MTVQCVAFLMLQKCFVGETSTKGVQRCVSNGRTDGRRDVGACFGAVVGAPRVGEGEVTLPSGGLVGRIQKICTA